MTEGFYLKLLSKYIWRHHDKQILTLMMPPGLHVEQKHQPLAMQGMIQYVALCRFMCKKGNFRSLCPQSTIFFHLHAKTYTFYLGMFKLEKAAVLRVLHCVTNNCFISDFGCQERNLTIHTKRRHGRCFEKALEFWWSSRMHKT